MVYDEDSWQDGAIWKGPEQAQDDKNLLDAMGNTYLEILLYYIRVYLTSNN